MSTLRFRPGPTIALVILLGTAVLVTLTEFILGFTLPESAVIAGRSRYQGITHVRKPFYRWALHQPDLRWDFEPHADWLAQSEGVDAKLFSIYTDKRGFILPGPVHDRPDLKIAFFGGSTTENALVAQESRFPYAAGRLIEARHRKKVNTYNVSKSGISSMNSLNNLINNALGVSPDIVVLYHNLNDLATLHRYGSYWNEGDASRSLVVWENVPEPALSASVLVRHFHARELLAATLSSIAQKVVPNIAVAVQSLSRASVDGPLPGAGDQLPGPGESVPMDAEAISAAFRRSLTTFIAVSRIWGAEPVLMTQANRFPEDIATMESMAIRNQVARWNRNYRMEYADIKRTYDRLNDVIREVAAQEKVLLIDLDRRIGKSEDNMYDLIHFTDKGSLEAARAIADALSERFNGNLK